MLQKEFTVAILVISARTDNKIQYEICNLCVSMLECGVPHISIHSPVWCDMKCIGSLWFK